MATIVTVHGTSDTGPEDGDRWWQRGGPLHQDLARWVAADAGEINFVPVLWSGLNSENGRYAASGALADKLTELEQKEEPYCLVGHSHGGSVMTHALSLMCERSIGLTALRRWITVGTPFIEFKRRRLLFSRLTTAGVAAYLILFYIFLMWIAFLASSFHLVFGVGTGLQNPQFDIMIMALAVPFLVGGYFLMRRLWQPAKLRMSSARVHSRVAAKISERWLGLWHSDDEVIAGGKCLKDVNFRPFSRDFAAPILAFVSLLLIPVFLVSAANADLYAALSGRIGEWMQFEAAAEPDLFKHFARNSFAIVVLPAIPILEFLDWANIQPTTDQNANRVMLGGTLLAGGTIGFAAIWLLGVLLHRFVLVSSRVISSAASKMLNALTQRQVVALGYGSDSHGEDAVVAHPYPTWFPTRFACLPPELEEDISRSSDEAASNTLRKLRAALSSITVEGDGNPADLLTRHLTWGELVHTNYFRVPRLRKLLAYIIAREPGFGPTDEFRRDPEFALMGEWLTLIKTERP